MLGSKNGKDKHANGSTPADAGALSIIAGGMRVQGDITASGIIKIDGTVQGSVASQRQVMIGRGASVTGDIVADEVVLAGTVTGNIQARSRLELQGSAIVHGDITTRAIVVLEGAVINGALTMEGSGVGGGARVPVEV